MKIVMLGWEYPPHISGGLGTACEGLTMGLSRHHLNVVFVVPHFLGDENAPHMTLVSSLGDVLDPNGEKGIAPPEWLQIDQENKPSKSMRTVRIPAMLQPYWNPEDFDNYLTKIGKLRVGLGAGEPEALQGLTYYDEANLAELPESRYSWDMFAEVDRFTQRVIQLMGNQDFDVIHAHDWMTFPAGIALSRLTGKPLVVHVHSLEFDRSGTKVNDRINQIEHHGLHAAKAVIAVSYYTRSVISQQHGVPLDKIAVVHNGVYPHQVVRNYRELKGWPSKVVLFLGRITFQKGPDYFVEAAAHVIPHVPDVLFVMAGAGDMLPRMMDRVRELGIGKHFHFPGFLRGPEVEEMFSVADVYVMPSVSEPFGISALEAISFDTPVIISRQSGVAEVLGHALKVDFWDVKRLAELIINALLHEELRADMVSMAREEVKRLRWDAAALKTIEVYRKMM